MRCCLKRFKRQLLVIFGRLRLLSPLLKILHRWHSHPQHCTASVDSVYEHLHTMILIHFWHWRCQRRAAPIPSDIIDMSPKGGNKHPAKILPGEHTGERPLPSDSQRDLKQRVQGVDGFVSQHWCWNPPNPSSPDDDDCFYYHSWRNNVVFAFGTLSSFLT